MYRRSSAMLRQRESARSQPSGSAHTALASATSAVASPGSAALMRTSADDNAGAAAPRVPGRGERPVAAHLDCSGAAEEQVAAAPANNVVAETLEALELRFVVAAFAMDVRLVQVHARRGYRLVDVEPVLQHVRH